TVLLKHLSPKSHVRTEGSPIKLSRFVAAIKYTKNPTHRIPAINCEPARRRETSLRKNTSSRTDPLTASQRLRKISQPRRLDSNVVICKGYNIALSLSNTGIEGMRF